MQIQRVLVRQPTREPTILSIKRFLTYAPTASAVRVVNSKGINIEWTEREEGISDYFHGVWLRHNCHCSLCLDQDSNQKIVDITHLDDPTVTHAAVNGENYWIARLYVKDICYII